MRRFLKAQRWFAHLADAPAQRAHMLGAVVGVQAETHLQFVDWLGGDAVVEDLVQALENIVIALEPADALLDRQAGLHGFRHWTDPRQRREILERTIGAHTLMKI